MAGLTDYHDEVYEPGDLLWWSGRHWQSRLIELFTTNLGQKLRGEWISHGSIIGHYGKAIKNWESTTFCPLPCDATGTLVSGVQCHDPIKEIEAYDGCVWITKMKRPLWPQQQRTLARWLEEVRGRPYDYDQAIGSASPAWVKRLIWSRPDDSAFYCDELQATALNVLNVIDWLNPSRLTPASLAHQCVDCNKYHPLKRIK